MRVLNTQLHQWDKGILLDLFPLEQIRFSSDIRRLTLSRIISYFKKLGHSLDCDLEWGKSPGINSHHSQEQLTKKE